jgi:putative transposase
MTEEKKIKGRKRHIGVDSLGNLLCVYIHAANIHDTIAGPTVFLRLFQKYRTIQAFSADKGYRKTSENFVKNSLRLPISLSKKIADSFTILPKRWIVERTFSWIGNSRRLSKDYEIREYAQANIVRLSMLKLTLAKCFT